MSAWSVRLVAVAAFVLGVPSAVAAQTPAGDRWQFALVPYLQLPHMNGTIGIGPVSAKVDASPSDIFSSLEFGAMLGAEARKGPWAIGFNGLYMDLGEEGSVTTPAGSIISGNVDGYQGAAELTGFRTLAPFLDVLAGGRVNFIGSSISVDGVELPGAAEVDEVWFDPFVGLRLKAPGTGNWIVTARGDVGGFGVGSKFAWQARATVGYRVSKLISVGLAYWAAGMDYEDDSSVPTFRYDVTTFGPQIGVGFNF